MDYFAIATLGFFPTPTPTDAQRMAFAASWGYLDTAPAPAVVIGRKIWGALRWGIGRFGGFIS